MLDLQPMGQIQSTKSCCLTHRADHTSRNLAAVSINTVTAPRPPNVQALPARQHGPAHVARTMGVIRHRAQSSTGIGLWIGSGSQPGAILRIGPGPGPDQCMRLGFDLVFGPKLWSGMQGKGHSSMWGQDQSLMQHTELGPCTGSDLQTISCL